jgi:hypothetical protein
MADEGFKDYVRFVLEADIQELCSHQKKIPGTLPGPNIV